MSPSSHAAIPTHGEPRELLYADLTLDQEGNLHEDITFIQASSGILRR